jgi:hypothetical protein
MSSIRKFAFAALFLVSAAALALAPAHAEGLAKGSSLLSVQFTTGVADLATPEGGTGGITAYDHSEWGGQLQFQHLLSDDWALAIGLGIGTFKETDQAGTNAPPATPDFVYSQSSMKVRIGADRFVHLTPTFHLFVGPGIEYWKGHGKFEQGANSIESEDATRWAFNGRMGAHVALGNTVGLEGHIGHYFGTASAKDTGAEVKWSPSGTESAVGLSFKF